MKTIRLHGWLGKQFGKTFTLDVATPAEVVRALCILRPSMSAALANDEAGFTVWVEKESLGERELNYPFSDRETLHIVPVIAGAKDGATQILLGIVLLATAFFTMGTSMLGTGLMYEAVMTGLTTFGTALVLGGISQMLFAPPMPEDTEAPENKPSYAFNGPVNTIQQGNCVPVLYGELIHGSQVVSAGLSVEDIAI